MAVSIRSGLSLDQTRRYWELLRVFVERSLSARYRGSALGIFWSLLNPLIMTGFYTAIFSGVFAQAYGEGWRGILNYALAAFTGLVIITFFSAATSQALTSVVANGPLLNKIRLPVSVFPVSINLANVFQFAVGPFPLLALITLIKSRDLLHVFALLLPFASLLLVALGVGFFVCTLYVFFRDLPYFYELVVFVLWISSPVFYPAKIVPSQVKPLLVLNPLTSIIETTRQIVLSNNLPDPLSLFGMLLGSVILFGIGWSFFRAMRSQFMDLL